MIGGIFILKKEKVLTFECTKVIIKTVKESLTSKVAGAGKEKTWKKK